MNIRWSVLALLTAIVLAAQGLSYWFTRDLLQSTISERESEKVGTVATIVQSLVGEYSEGTQLAARVLGSSERLARSVSARGGRTERLGDIAAPLLRDQGLDFLEVTDDREIVRFSVRGAARVGLKAEAWGVAEAMQGKGTMVADVDAAGVAVLAIEPLREGGRIVGSVIVGRRVNEAFLQDLARKVQAELALVSRTSIIAASSPVAAQAVDKAAIEEAFHQKIPVHRSYADGMTKVVFLPLLIVDDGFVMMVRLDSSSAYRALQESVAKALRWTVLFLLASALAAYMLLSFVLKPLRVLRSRAEQTAIAVTGTPIQARPGDEIGSVVQVLDTLTQRLVEQNTDLARSRGEASAASEAKSQFLSRMSHEIRTPLNGVLGMAELLRATPLTADQRRYCEAITASGRSLHELLGDILDLSKIEANRITLESIDFDLGQLLDDLRAAFAEPAAARSNRLVATLALAPGGRFRGDPTRVRQVLSNLLSNAVKFTQAGRITLDVSTLEGRAGDARTWLRFSVQDSGIGIAPEALATLFQPFVQADSSTTRRYGGSGLGLVICRHLVELLGGSLQCRSVPGEGTRFWFDLPFAAAESPAPASGPEMPAAPQRLAARVLLAEDIAINQEVISLMLARAGVQVRCVDNGELAVQALREAEYDVVLMDCQMPVMDGIEAARRIRAEEVPGRRVPIIALTANAFSEDRECCLAAGMDDYLSKPVQWELLLRKVAQWSAGAVDTAPETPIESLPPPEPSSGEGPLQAAILDRLAGEIGPKAAARVLRIYLDNSAAEIESLRQSAGTGDLESFGARLHSLKSSSRTLGGLALADLAQAGERLARETDAHAFGMLGAIIEAVNDFCRALAAHPLSRQGA